MVVTEDMDWISVLNDVCYSRWIMVFCLLLRFAALQDDVVFPEPDVLCKRILKTHELQSHQGWYLSPNRLSAD
jgi:hypothetical protein